MLNLQHQEVLIYVSKHWLKKGLNALYKVYKQIDLFRLPLRSANKIFVAAITPIVTYGAEIWGIFSKFDLKNGIRHPLKKFTGDFARFFQV